MSSSSLGRRQGISKIKLKIWSNSILFIRLEVHADETAKRGHSRRLGEGGAWRGVWEVLENYLTSQTLYLLLYTIRVLIYNFKKIKQHFRTSATIKHRFCGERKERHKFYLHGLQILVRLTDIQRDKSQNNTVSADPKPLFRNKMFLRNLMKSVWYTLNLSSHINIQVEIRFWDHHKWKGCYHRGKWPKGKDCSGQSQDFKVHGRMKTPVRKPRRNVQIAGWKSRRLASVIPRGEREERVLGSRA